jgi:ParB-like chromosome segregation protein Spo0J
MIGHMKVKDRVKELRRVRAGDLRPCPGNWRMHPKAQQDALRGLLAEIGFADALLARELPDGTLELIDGHLRAETVPDQEVPVLVLDVSEAEARKLLATLDPLAALATADAQKLEALLAEVETGSESVQALLDGLAREHGLATANVDADGNADAERPSLERFQILIECATEQEQASLLERLTAEGLTCRSLIV